MNHAGNGHPEFDFFIDDAVTADHDRAAFFHLFSAALENLAQNFDVHLAFREANDVHARFGLAAHGVDVTQGVSRGNLAKDIGVIDDRRKKIHRVDDREIGPESIDPGIVGRVGADKQIGIPELGELVQDLREVGGAELSGSTRGFDLLRQPHWLFVFKQHTAPTVDR